jgi:hypothetical protein
MKLTFLACVAMVCLTFAYSSYMHVVSIQIQLDYAREMQTDKMAVRPKI